MHPVCLQHSDRTQRSTTPSYWPWERHSSDAPEARKAAPSRTPCRSSVGSFSRGQALASSAPHPSR
eukprot:3998379-Alexandrium_andersonii.AAC.1